jgi:hypothetical protein
MKKEDFELSVTGNGETYYLHIENGKKRKQLLSDRMSGKISTQQFIIEQKKMRGEKYLKYIYTKSEMERTIC